jgi:hypothetical protein
MENTILQILNRLKSMEKTVIEMHKKFNKLEHKQRELEKKINVLPAIGGYPRLSSLERL